MKHVAIMIPTLGKGGAEKQGIQLLNALGEKYRIQLIITYPEVGYEPELLSSITSDNYEIYKLSGSTLRRLMSIYNILREGKTDAMFCYLTWPDFYGPIIGKLAGVAKIYQGIRSVYLPKSKLKYELIGNKLATGVIINNYAGVEIFEKAGIKNMTVIPNCYPNIQDFYERPKKDVINIITVARFVEQKDYYTALSVIANVKKQVPNIKYWILGHGELEGQIRMWISELKLDETVSVFINPHGILNYLKEADIYLSTSLFEGTSNSIMEAMDASLPVVTTNAGDNDRLVKNGLTGFCTVCGDVVNLSNAIMKLVSSYEMRIDMGQKGHELLCENYSFSKFKENYLRLLAY